MELKETKAVARFNPRRQPKPNTSPLLSTAQASTRVNFIAETVASSLKNLPRPDSSFPLGDAAQLAKTSRLYKALQNNLAARCELVDDQRTLKHRVKFKSTVSE